MKGLQLLSLDIVGVTEAMMRDCGSLGVKLSMSSEYTSTTLIDRLMQRGNGIPEVQPTEADKVYFTLTLRSTGWWVQGCFLPSKCGGTNSKISF